MACYKNGKFRYTGENDFLSKHGWHYHGAGLWSFEGEESMSEPDAIRIQRSINVKEKTNER